jgi:hypothetical protein
MVIAAAAMLQQGSPIADTGSRRPRAIEHSDFYYLRLGIHRYASYAIVPAFVTEYALGQSMYNHPPGSSGTRTAHSVAAIGVVGLFGLNTVTGAWNLWDSSRDQPGRLRRTADAGFVATEAVAPGRRRARPEPPPFASHARALVDGRRPGQLRHDAGLEMTAIAAQLISRWAHLYGDDKAVSAAVTYIHLAGILLG